jgi:hypothetical protein
MHVGHSGMPPLFKRYRGSFPFAGRLHSIAFDLADDEEPARLPAYLD